MRIAFSSYSGFGAWFMLRLLYEGHKVDYYLSEEKFAPILEGIVPRPHLLRLDHRFAGAANAGFPAYKNYDLSLFDLTGRKRQADFSSTCCPTIGDGTLHCVLEDERSAGISIMEEAGIGVPPYEKFGAGELSAAKAHIKKTGKRFVFKPDGGQDQDTATTYVSKSAEDMLDYIDKVHSMSKGAPFILQEFTPGIEVSTEGWFNGTDFYCLNCTLEEKKFMNDNIGPNTGCSGNLVFRISDKARIFTEGLGKMKPLLSALGFRGMIDLNVIATEDKLNGLEWTPRFGYDASATLMAMYAGNFGEMLHAIANGDVPEESWRSEYGASVRLTIPPYPTEIKRAKIMGTPIKGLDMDDPEEVLQTYLYDVMLLKKELVCAGISGLIAVPINVSSEPLAAYEGLEKRIKMFDIPDMQYRSDVKKSTLKRHAELDRMGWL